MSPGTFVLFGAGSTGITGWTVATTPPGGVDLVSRTFGGTFPVRDGELAPDLNHDNVGGIFQDLATTVGQTYQLTFFVSGVPSAGCIVTNPKTLTVSAGSTAQDYTYTPNASASPAGNQPFDQHTLTFAATGTTTRLTFTSTSAGCAGPVIDNVSVVPLA